MNLNIFDLIPQRPPFLFVDKILEKSSNKIITEYLVKGTEDFFKGHFPGMPVMPGVILQEAVFQSAAALLSNPSRKGTGVITRVFNAKFRSIVTPQNLLNMEIEIIENHEIAFVLKGVTKVNGKIVLSIEFMVAVVENL